MSYTCICHKQRFFCVFFIKLPLYCNTYFSISENSLANEFERRMFSLAIIPQIVPQGLQDTVPPVLKVQIFYSATPSSHYLPRFDIRCRVGATFVFVFTDTGKITAVIFTSSSGVLFILSQWNRKTITIQSTRRSICHTTNSGETMPDMS